MKRIKRLMRRAAALAPTAALAVLVFVLAALPADLAAQDDESPGSSGSSDDYMPLLVKVEPILSNETIVGLAVEVSNIPQYTKTQPIVPFTMLTCYVEIRHMETGRCLNPQPIRISIRAPRNGLVPTAKNCKYTSRLPLNSGTWLVEATLKPGVGAPIAFGDNAFSITPAKVPLEMAQDRKSYEAMLDSVEELCREIDAYAEFHRKQGRVGAKTAQKEWQDGLAARVRELKGIQGKLGKNKVRAIDFCGGTKKLYSSLIDAYLAYGGQKIIELMGPEYVIAETIRRYGEESFEKKLEQDGFKYDPEGPSKSEQVLAFVKLKMEEQMAARVEALVKSRMYIANELDIAIVTARHLAGDLAMIRAMTESLFDAYLAAEEAFPVAPAAGGIWEQQWLDDYNEIESSIPNRYKPAANKMPGIFTDYADIDVKLEAALKAMRALRDEVLFELYERHGIPKGVREHLETIDAPIEGAETPPAFPGTEKKEDDKKKVKQPIQVLAENYDELVGILAKERAKYVDPLLDVYGDFAKVRKILDLPQKPSSKIISDIFGAKYKADDIFRLKFAEYTLPQGTRKAIQNQSQKLVLMATINMAGKRDPVDMSGVTPGDGTAPDGEEDAEGEGTTPGGEGEGEGEGGEGTEPEPPPTQLVGKAAKFYDALMGAYDKFVEALEENLKNALLSEPLPAKPALRTFEQIAEDKRKKEEEEKKEKEGTTPFGR